MFRQLLSGTSTLETVNDAIIQNEVMQSSFLVDQGLSEHVVRGDGNCLFRAVSFILFDTESLHMEIRQLAVRTLLDNPNIFSTLFSNINEYNDRVAGLVGGTFQEIWGGADTMYALSLALNAEFRVVNRVRNTYTEFDLTLHPHVTNPSRTINLLYTNDHYNSLIPHTHLPNPSRAQNDLIGQNLQQK